jgi:hypothetical protein
VKFDLLMIFLVPFLSGLSSSKVGTSAGDGVDASTVAVINEICERALQSDVSAAVAAARAVAGAHKIMLQSCHVMHMRMSMIINLFLLQHLLSSV